jgi:putative ABC transport system substrate-binding protein
MLEIRRREFIGGAAAWPMAARAQQAAVPVVGYLYDGSPEPVANRAAAFRKGLSETGFVEGRNVAIEYRFAHGEIDRLPELAADLVHRRVAVIHTQGILASLAGKVATTTIPIVFSTGTDPVQADLVASLNRPGGNVTGMSYLNRELGAKRLGLLHELLPGATRFAVLVNPNSPNIESTITELRGAASTIGRQLEVLTAGTNRDIDVAFASLAQKRAEALLVANNSLFDNRRVQLATLAVLHRLPAIYAWRESVEAGGLMSYGANTADQSRQAGIYTGRILRGEKPADLPVMQPTKFELVINLHTARLLGIEVPPTLLALADVVIE